MKTDKKEYFDKLYLLNIGKKMFFAFFLITALSCNINNKEKQPNVILIMVDDMGYECLGSYGSTSYSTPVLDAMASQGIQFNNCVSQPLCTPSRVKIMTGQYNYRNYDYFGHLNTKEYTFGNLMKDAGYETCIAGKWQLNGLAYKDEIEDWNDSSKPNKLGFDEYCLWQLTQTSTKGGRFTNPLIEQNGELLKRDEDAYGPDIFANYILDFIERKKDKPFFVYYPMVLVHNPFVPTPDSKNWENKKLRFKSDTAYFKDMVSYTDKIVGRIRGKLKELNIDDNTIVIFTGDNGTNPAIYSKTTERIVRGAKGNTIDHGTHVPLIVSWPHKIKKGFVYDDLIEFSDFYATLSEIVKKKNATDGDSFYALLNDEEFKPRKTAFVHYDPKWGKNVNKYRNQFARTQNYKLYQDGRFYDLNKDIMEKNPISIHSLNEEQQNRYDMLKLELSKHPKFK